MKTSKILVAFIASLVVMASVFSTAVASSTSASSKRIIAYYTSWGTGRMAIADIPDHLLTHLNYSFINVSADGECIVDQPAAHGAQLTELRTLYPDLYLVLSVGGWTWSENFSDAAMTAASRQQFAESCVDLMVQYDFDGLDIDWEFPVRPGEVDTPGRPEDRENFTGLLADLRQQLDMQGAQDGRHYELSIAAPSSAWFYNALELDKIHEHLDYINLMTYSFVGGWSGTTGLDSALYADSSSASSVDSTVNAFLGAGIPSDKLVVGIGYVGTGWRDVPDANNGLYQTAGNTIPAINLFYRTMIDSYLSNPDYAQYWEPTAQVPYLYNSTNNDFISYMNPQGVFARSQYVLENDLGGVMFWELTADTDDYVLTTALDVGFNQVVQLTAPVDGAPVPIEAELTWQGAPSATMYMLEIAEDAAFTLPVMMTTTAATTYTLDGMSEGSYFWRIQPLFVEYGAGANSEVRTFTLSDTTTPTAISLQAGTAALTPASILSTLVVLLVLAMTAVHIRKTM